MDLQAHWQALYDEMRDALDDATPTLSSVPIYHVNSTDDQLGQPAAPPFVTYRDETLRPIGTQGKGNSALLTSGFVIVSRAFELADALTYTSVIATGLDSADSSMVTSDGYATTDISILGAQSLYEPDSKLYAVHLRVSWQRSR